MNEHHQKSEIWEVQVILYLILAIMLEKMMIWHWQAVVVAIWAGISFIGVLVENHRGMKEDRKI